MVDIRIGSPTYGKWLSVELSSKNGKQLFIPCGFLHGFKTLENNTQLLYKCSNYYEPTLEHTVNYNDADLAID